MKSISLYRLNGILLLGILSVIALYYGRLFLIPLSFAIILSMLMLPVSRKLEKWGLNRFWSTMSCVLIILLFVAGFMLIIAAQAASFSEDMPQIQQRLHELMNQTQAWIQEQFGVTPQKQVAFIKSQITKLSASAKQYLTSILQGTIGIVAAFVLVILYMFFLMWKREKYKTFILKLVSSESQAEAKRTLEQITKVSGQYLTGRLLSMLFVAVFYSIAFTILGLKNAILISVIAVIPNLIPYVGAFIGAFFPLIMTLISGSTGMFIPTVAILISAQVIDNNIIEPLVMGAQLSLSPIMTIFAIVIGELIWGIPGMLLFEPLFAIIRIICSHIPQLNPFSYVMSDDKEVTRKPGWARKIKQALFN
ncbi:AI-2E family transporter [Adhaeribacter sp. BT258]|uniref:AI-2E family transporter n=1 Tax=Adhaeribacter terrigena TaxID=2793070 RepID=A0ABS1C860_9BACT|nr:AI-2E family transporter [Adhaeribacter terrigena]MBK0404780.1 AI-2E family transporter [Adhaeribacter terrigena]